MREQREDMVLPTAGTAIGKYAGGLSTIPSCDLAAQVARETVARAGAQPPRPATLCSAT